MENDGEEKFCGNCDSHNSYDYPTKVFCSTRYWKNKSPIVDTLWHCEDWNKISQECYCIREAKKKAVSAAELPQQNRKTSSSDEEDLLRKLE